MYPSSGLGASQVFCRGCTTPHGITPGHSQTKMVVSLETEDFSL